jgi:NitT/TauT family transport system ATP-binding protein
LEKPVLEAKGVGKVFGAGKSRYVALDGIDLTVPDGQFLCLLGASGCGKSTLLNIMAGFEPATSGKITFDDRPIRGAGRDRMMFFQDAGSALLPWLTVEENMRFALRIRNFPRPQWDDVVHEYLTLVDLERHRNKFPAHLSGGMRQRLQIARGLAVDPRVLLMDEPFAALDALTRRRMHAMLLQILQHTQKTVVFVTHDIWEAIILADRIAVMSVGPASGIMHVFTVDLARPRDPSNPVFGGLSREIEQLLGPEIDRSERKIA